VRDPAGVGEHEVDRVGTGRVMGDEHNAAEFERVEHGLQLALMARGLLGRAAGTVRPSVAEPVEGDDPVGREQRC